MERYNAVVCLVKNVLPSGYQAHSNTWLLSKLLDLYRYRKQLHRWSSLFAQSVSEKSLLNIAKHSKCTLSAWDTDEYINRTQYGRMQLDITSFTLYCPSKSYIDRNFLVSNAQKSANPKAWTPGIGKRRNSPETGYGGWFIDPSGMRRQIIVLPNKLE